MSDIHCLKIQISMNPAKFGPISEIQAENPGKSRRNSDHSGGIEMD
jgi:hypothetical protein